MIEDILEKSRSQSRLMRSTAAASQFARISEEVETLYRKPIPVASSTHALSLKDKIYALPFTGYFAKLLIAIAKLPVRLRQIYEQLADLNRIQGELQREVSESQNTLQCLKEQISAQESQIAILKDLNHNVFVRTERFESMISEKVQRSQEQTADLEARLLRIQNAARSETSSEASAGSSISSAFYAAFERRFRSPSDRLEQHLQNYLPYLGEAQPHGAPLQAVDLGCGRGEWLKILKARGFEVTGVDINTITNEAFVGTGIPVIEKDALGFLEGRNKLSLDLISSFHLIEHVEPGYLLNLIQQAFRVLKPGGLLILETPNPENLIVGACNFYIDPTHRHPIPPLALGFMMNYFGFEQLDCLRFEPALGAYSGPDSYLKDISRYFSVGQDYAIVARKPEIAKDPT